MAREIRDDVLVRLKKIEGQPRGLQKMIDHGEDCAEIIHQLSAVRKALDKVGSLILTHRMRECLEAGEDGCQERVGRSHALVSEPV